MTNDSDTPFPLVRWWRIWRRKQQDKAAAKNKAEVNVKNATPLLLHLAENNAAAFAELLMAGNNAAAFAELLIANGADVNAKRDTAGRVCIRRGVRRLRNC